MQQYSPFIKTHFHAFPRFAWSKPLRVWGRLKFSCWSLLASFGSMTTATVRVPCSPPILEDATQVMKDGKYDEAYQRLTDYVKDFELAKVFAALAQCAFELGRYNEVPDLVAASAIGLGHEDQHVLHLAGLALLKADRCEEAYLSLHRALKLRPKCPKIHGALKDVAEKMQAWGQNTFDAPCLWQYQTQDGGWNDMSLQLCEELESAFADYQANSQSASFATCGWEFDFGTMQQRNIDTGRARSLWRQCVAAIAQTESHTGQVLRTCLSKIAECCQAIAAADDVRSALARHFDDVRKRRVLLTQRKKTDLAREKTTQVEESGKINIIVNVAAAREPIDRQKESLEEWKDQLTTLDASIQRQQRCLEEEINLFEHEKKQAWCWALQNHQAIFGPMEEIPSCTLANIILGQRQELELWRCGKEDNDDALTDAEVWIFRSYVFWGCHIVGAHTAVAQGHGRVSQQAVPRAAQ